MLLVLVVLVLVLLLLLLLVLLVLGKFYARASGILLRLQRSEALYSWNIAALWISFAHSLCTRCLSLSVVAVNPVG